MTQIYNLQLPSSYDAIRPKNKTAFETHRNRFSFIPIIFNYHSVLICSFSDLFDFLFTSMSLMCFQVDSAARIPDALLQADSASLWKP